MKSSFIGYYPPTPAEYERLWREATIVLDTNVLLNLYRLPASARDEFLTVLDLLKERLWVPHQVALEFQRNRLTVIAAERKSAEDVLNSLREIVGELRKKVDTLQIEKQGLGIETKPILEDLQRANETLVSAVAATHSARLEIASSDPVRDRLDALLSENIGPCPQNQGDLDKLFEDGERRFQNHIPPGFADAEKGKNPSEATFIHDHLKYQRKFGDLLLWKQLLEYTKKNSIKCVLLITADRKEDWWWREQGKTIGAHPELVSEIHRYSSVDLFWMYSSVQFLQHANQYTAAQVSTQAVEELQQVVVSPQTPPHHRDLVAHYNLNSDGSRARAYRQGILENQRPDYRRIEAAVAAWLSIKHSDVRINTRGFPDLIAYDAEDAHGFEIINLRDLGRMPTSAHLMSAILRGLHEMKSGRLAFFTLIIVVEDISYLEDLDLERISEWNRKISRSLSDYPIEPIIIGSVCGDAFEVLALQRNLDLHFRQDSGEL